MGISKIRATTALALAAAALLALAGCFPQAKDTGLGGGYQPPLIVDGLAVAKGNDGITSIATGEFTDPSADFAEAGVLTGDILGIQSGFSLGEYLITQVGQNTVTASGLNPASRETGVAYTINGRRIYVSGIDGYLYALGEYPLTEAGKLLLSSGLEAGARAPVVGKLEADGFLYAVHPGTANPNQDAKIGWRRPERAPIVRVELVSAPVLDRATNTVVATSEDGNLYAYNATNGQLRDGFPFKAEDKIWSTPVIRDGVIYFGSHDKKVYAVFLDSGNIKWEFATDGVVAGRPLLFKDQVIVGSFDKNLYSLNVLDGSVRWQVNGNNWFWAGAVSDGTTIFAPSMDGNIYALDRGGNLLWKHDIGSPIVSTPVLTPEGLVVAGKNGALNVLDTTNRDIGSQRMIYSPSLRDADILAPLHAAGSSIFVGATDNTVSRWDLGTQRQIWCFHTEELQCN